MGAINLPFNIVNDDPLDASQVMADLQAITQVANGGLEANTNVSTASAVTQPGSANSEGVAATIARSDHLHINQGFENLASDPTTGNFKGRVYWNTATNELRYCTDATGSGTFGSFTPTAAELVIHAAQHKDGGHDPLADNTITDHMLAAKTNIFSATLGADHASISATNWSNIIDLTTVTTTGQQTLGIAMSLRFQTSGGGGSPNAQYRLVDLTASNTTVWTSQSVECDAGVQTECIGFVYYTVPAAGPRSFRIQAAATTNVSGGVSVLKHTFVSSETVAGPTIQVVVL